VIFLLVSKLIVGEFTHAMPHMAAPVANAPANEIVAPGSPDDPPCADHVQPGASESQPAQHSTSDESADKSCCENGVCVCPCLHSPAATAAVPLTLQRANDNQLTILVEGAVLHRLSALFRPPA
jgi:hypothetical protein